MTSGDSDIVWEPDSSSIARSALAEFSRRVERDHGVSVADYRDLWRWSVENVDRFWAAVWNFYDVNRTPAPDTVLAARTMPGANWFPGARLNFVERVFIDRDATATAVIAATEDDVAETLTWGQLEQQVAAMAATLRELGVKAGDRVVGYLPNCTAAVVGFLAAASIGAIWSCCGTDYAAAAAASRLSQLEPAVLICADGYRFGGRSYDRRAEAVALAELLPGLTAVVQVGHLGLTPPAFGVAQLDWDVALERSSDAELIPHRVPFDHPLWVLYSSGAAVPVERSRRQPLPRHLFRCVPGHLAARGLGHDHRARRRGLSRPLRRDPEPPRRAARQRRHLRDSRGHPGHP